MRQLAMVGGGLIVSMVLMGGTGWGDFFDDLLQAIPQEQHPQDSQDSENPQEQPDMIDQLGGILGAKPKDLNLLKKGLGVIEALEPIGEEEERVLGQAVAVEAFSRFGGEYRHEELTRYMNFVGKTIGEVSDRPNLNYHFAILNSQEQNAFAAPGGYIFVTIGLLKTLKNEAELAGVLAHEVAHVTKEHMLETIRRGALLSNVSELTLSAMDKDPGMFSNIIDEITDKLFTKGLDQELEFEADAYGIEFAYRAGYNPEGLRNYLQTLRSQKGRAQSRFFTTHPSTGLRIEKITNRLREFSDGLTLPILTQRFRHYMQKA